MAVIHPYYDDSYVRDLLVRLARGPTDGPPGAVEIDPTDSKIRHFVHDVERPEIDPLGLGPVAIDDLNDLVVRRARMWRLRVCCSWHTLWPSTETTLLRSRKANS